MKLCAKCAYYRRISTSDRTSLMVCHYLLDTGCPRPCSAEECICCRNAVTKGDYIKLISAEFGGKGLISMMQHYDVKSLRRLTDTQARDYYALLGGEKA